MITGPLKSRIDNLWNDFEIGGINNPLTVIEQITFLMYSRHLDMKEHADEEHALLVGKPFNRSFGDDEQDCRWNNWHLYDGGKMLSHVRSRVFPHFRRLAERSTGTNRISSSFVSDAQLLIEEESLLKKTVAAIGELPLKQGNTWGVLYEYLLSKLTTAGINGQFRTPRHITRMMVELMRPQHTDRICDPSCGTGGFLVEAYDYLMREHTSDTVQHIELVDGETHISCNDDLLTDQGYREQMDSSMFTAYDFDATMMRIASMNLLMHDVGKSVVHYQDTLSQGFEERHPKGSEDAFDLILTNPPFKGSRDDKDVAPDLLRVVKTKKTELLFIALVLRMLKVGGRCAIIVPDSMLFSSSKAHVQLRQHLIDNNQLKAVVSLPSGVFKPYSDVATAIIIFVKGGKTANVFFYDLQSVGFTLDNKLTQIAESKGDLPGILAKYHEWCGGATEQRDRAAKAFEVSAAEICAQGYDISINRYKQRPQIYGDPRQILRRLQETEAQIRADLAELEGLIR